MRRLLVIGIVLVLSAVATFAGGGHVPPQTIAPPQTIIIIKEPSGDWFSWVQIGWTGGIVLTSGCASWFMRRHRRTKKD